MTAIPITREEYEAKFGGSAAISTPNISSSGPIPITREEYAAKFAPETLGFREQIAGGFGNVLDTLTLGGGDEIVGAGSGLINYLKSKSEDGLTLGDAISLATDQQKGYREAYTEQNPITSGLGTVAGALNTFVPNVFTKAPGVLNAGANILKGGALGAGYSGVNRYLSNEGDAVQRLEGVPQAAAIGAAIGAPLQAGAEIIQGVGRKAAGYADDLENAMVGYKPENKTKIGGFLDAQGNKVESAVSGGMQVGKADESIDNLRELGFFDRIKANWTPKQVSNELSVFKNEAGGKIGSVVDEVTKVEQELAPWQKQELLSKVSPDFSEAKSLINELKDVDPVTARRLGRKLDAIDNAWSASDGSMLSFKNLQEKFGLINQKSFDPKATVEQKLADTLNNKIYGSLAESLSTRVENLGGPELLSKFKTANQAYSSAATWEEKAFNASRKSGFAKAGNDLFGNVSGGARSIASYLLSGVPGLGPVLIGERALTAASDIAPVQVSKLADLLSTGASKVTSGSKLGLLGLSQVPDTASASQMPIDNALSTLSKGNADMPKGITPKNTPDISLDEIPKEPEKRVAYVEKLIDQDPVDAAIYQLESGRNPFAKNSTSTASGAFQLIKKTASKLGVKDVFDIADNYKGYLKLKAENQKVLENLGMDPNDGEALYSLHYLGAPVFKKLINGDDLSEKEQSQVDYLKSKVLPKFNKIYNNLIEV